MENAKKIIFKFQPMGDVFKGEHVIEKEENGKKRRYLKGISSGTKIDGHGERMSEKAIKSFMSQADSQEILLYPDVHGIKASEDIGKLVKQEVLADGDWYTEYRLYDTDDGVGAVKLEKINDIWKQACGLPPYTKPRQKGFSIEGWVPDGKIINATDETGTHPVIDEVILDGVCLVPSPAYKPSVAVSAYKSLGEKTPIEKEREGLRKKAISEFKEKIKDSEGTEFYFRRRDELADALEDTIREIMTDQEANKRDQLVSVFDTYRDEVVSLILNNESVFKYTEPYEVGEDIYSGSKVDVSKRLYDTLSLLNKALGLIQKQGQKNE